MSRRAAVIDEFDDDVDLPLPARPLPNTGSRGAILREITDDDDGNDDYGNEDDGNEAPPPRRPAAGPASSQQPGTVTDITPYKEWTCIYPIYIDAKQPYCTGARRLPRQKSVWWPLSQDIAEASNRLGLGTLHEVNKSHPRDWENPGRVRVQYKKDGRPVNPTIKTKKQLLERISIQIQHLKPDSIPTPPYAYPVPVTPPAAKPSKLKLGSSKSSGSSSQLKSKGGAKPPKRDSRPLPSPPDPIPSLASRISPYSPALPSGVLVDTVKAGMSAPEGAPAVAGSGGKGKKKIIRVRG